MKNHFESLHFNIYYSFSEVQTFIHLLPHYGRLIFSDKDISCLQQLTHYNGLLKQQQT
jgi:hypothetical protein